jgi:6-pyruvoyltetrahydropterin/6-carboxytetrahydropterin synthase
MTFHVGVVGHFTARHRLVGDFGPSSLPHAHDYTVEVSVTGGTLRADGTLFDITRLQGALQAALADLESLDLNELAELAEPNPTAEVVARYFFQRVAVQLRGQGLGELEARVWESPEAYASYAGDLD